MGTCAQLFDYPVFVAAPKTVGISSTGETGEGVPSELPNLLKAYREFEAWLAKARNGGHAKFSGALHCVIRRWREIERWIENKAGEVRASDFPLLPLSEVLVPRQEPVRIGGTLGDWQAITIKFSGEVLPRERAHAFKGAMFRPTPVTSRSRRSMRAMARSD